MQRYRLHQGKLREHDEGEWVKAEQLEGARTCPRCNVCANSSHHWIEQPDLEFRWEYVCKHCPAVGLECKACHGNGCPACDDEGVVELKRRRPTEGE